MKPFRKEIPSRRLSAHSVSNYKDYRDILKVDFHDRCGYCDNSYTWRTIWFEIDHFVPKGYLVVMNEESYSNLVYSCRSCNNSKRAKWPSKSETIHNLNNQGFIDPCNPKYDEQFIRDDSGSIQYRTDLGEWMYHELKLHRPQHQIIWLIEQIDINILELQMIAPHINNPELSTKIGNILHKLYACYHTYTKKLAEY